MAATPITKALLANPPPLPEGQAKLRLFDSRLKGLIVEFRRSTTTFYFRYRDGRGRAREVKLGRLGDVTLEQARKRAELLKAETSLGADPVADADKKKAIPTVGEFIADRYLPHIRDRLRSHDTVAVFCRRIDEALGRKALDEVTQADVAAFRKRILGLGLSNATTNRHLATLRSMFNLANRWQLYQGANPAASPGMLPETHRDVYLSAQETQALVRALDDEPNQDAAAALMLLILTGARKNEILKARWEYVDLSRSLLTVPRSKSGKPRHIPLSAVAARVLVRQYQKSGSRGAGYVFPGKIAGTPLEDIRGPWKRARKAAGLLPDTRIHDLRHSFASALANQGVPLNEIGVILGHSQLSTTARYAHHAPQRLVETATVAARAWNLLEGPKA
ncbi:tyrosine-type recombinase/integrase [Novispirillum sp. DQ9]|uniref:phage integrase n=1 Tax=Novispirillum sp. DQ9 TaxID=3398612 RepID=UPI003C7C3343